MRKVFLLSFVLVAAMATRAQTFELKPITLANVDNAPAPVHPLPHDRQVKWMETEFYAFFHYGMDTFTGQEWGDGSENKSRYAPTEQPDPGQWLDAAQKAHMKGGIAVVKHHDGFCLWPTATTDHCIKGLSGNAAYNVAEGFAQAAMARKMKYGFYVSPWDRNSAKYGDPSYVTDVFLKQCEELSKYGNDQFEMWFDGANGGDGYYGGQRGSRTIDKATYYDVPNLRWLVHKTNLNCVLWGEGGEARWIGNEDGIAGETNWCAYNRGGNNSSLTTGSANGWMWLPGESDAKSSGGWFWSSTKDSFKGADELFKMYLETVGRNSTLILNLPPSTNGKLRPALVANLTTLGNLLDTRLGTNLAAASKGATVTALDVRTGGKYEPANLIDENKDTYYATNDGTETAEIIITLPQAQTIHYVMLQEYIRLGQRVKAFTIETSTDNVNWTRFGGEVPTTTIGYKRIIPQSGSTSNYGSGISAKYIRVKITDCKSVPVLSNIAVY